MPPPLVVMILLPLNENAARAPCPPAGAPRYVAPSDSAASWTSTTLVALAHRPERVVVAALAVEVDREHRADVARPPRGVRRSRGRAGRGRSSTSSRPRRRRTASPRCTSTAFALAANVKLEHGDLVARADPEDDEGEVERGSPARERDAHARRRRPRRARARTRRRAGRAARSSSTRSPRRRARPRARRGEEGRGRCAAPSREPIGHRHGSRYGGAPRRVDGDTSGVSGHGMVFLGFGKYVRADRIYALEPITGGDRGSGQPDTRVGRGDPRADRRLAHAGDDPRGDRSGRRARVAAHAHRPRRGPSAPAAVRRRVTLPRARRRKRPRRGARPDRLDAARRRRRRQDRRGRGLPPGRSGEPLVPRPDTARRDHVRAARAPLRLPLVRNPLVREHRLRGRRARARRCSCARSSRRTAST